MRTYKKIIAFLTALCIVSAPSLAQASEKEQQNYEKEDNAYLDGDFSVEDGAEIYVPTQEEKLLREQRDKEIADYFKNRATGTTNENLDVTCFKQENNYYCGPATTKQVIHYLKGYSSTQKTYADKDHLNTDQIGATAISTILKVLNKEQSVHTYVSADIDTFSNFKTNIRYDSIHKVPVVLDIRVDSSYRKHFNYTTNGHFINTSGYNNTSEPVAMNYTDPNGPNLGSHTINAQILYDVTNAHPGTNILY